MFTPSGFDDSSGSGRRWNRNSPWLKWCPLDSRGPGDPAGPAGGGPAGTSAPGVPTPRASTPGTCPPGASIPAHATSAPDDAAAPLPEWEYDLPSVPRHRLGPALDVDAPADASHHGALEAFTPLLLQRGAGLHDGEVLELMAAWARQVSAAEARVRAWAAVLASRPSMEPLWRSSTGEPLEVAADEVAFRLGVSRRFGQQLIDEGKALGGPLWPVAEALEAGRIDARKASLVIEALTEQPLTVMVAVCDQVLPVAGELNHTAFARRIASALVQVDPDGAGQRHERAVSRRRVNRPRPRPDGMAFFSALLPAVEAAALENACEAAARAARALGDGRTLEQLRADALTSMGIATLTAGTLTFAPAPGRPVRGSSRRYSRRTGGARRTGPSDATAGHTDVGFDSGPGSGSGSGPGSGSGSSPGFDASACHTASGFDPGSDSDSGSDSGTLRVRFSGRTAPVRIIASPAAQQGHPTPVPLVDAVERSLYGAPQGEDASALDPFIDWTGILPARPGIDVPELVGYGPLAPATVRAWVNRSGSAEERSWLSVEDPVTAETPTPPDAPGYRPTAELDRHVRRRDIVCTAPGCSTSAYQGDLDHAVRYPEGRTSAENLHALCRRHHLLRTHAGHTCTHDGDGGATWTTPTGQTLRSTAAGDLTRARGGRQPGLRRHRTVDPEGYSPTSDQVVAAIARHDAYERGWDGEDPDADTDVERPLPPDPHVLLPRAH